jgi:RNA polymerase sigma-70 factor (ECF subfamily)
MPPSTADLFPLTRWSLLQRVRNGTPEEAQAALEILCRAYWHPLYCVARRRQLNEQDAQDAVQGFLVSILRRETFATADSSIGKLRHLLLKAFENFCGQQWAHSTRQKRGGGAEHVALNELIDTGKAEESYLKADASLTIELLYQRAWANAVLERSLARLREDYTRRGWQDRFELLVAPLLQQDDETKLTDLAAKVGTTPGALRVTLHRMRGHYREMIEHEVASTLETDDPRLIREELAELFKAFA